MSNSNNDDQSIDEKDMLVMIQKNLPYSIHDDQKHLSFLVDKD